MTKFQTRSSATLFLTLFFFIFLPPNLVFSQCNSSENKAADQIHHNNVSSEATKYKLVAVASTLVASTVGICLPIIAKSWSYLSPESDLYFLIKAFAAGVILATGFIHVLPDAFVALENPCIKEKKPWGKKFPFSGFIAMVAAAATLIMKALITGYHKRSELVKPQPPSEDDEQKTLHGSQRLQSSDILRHSIVSQILELGIVVHSMIVGISLGASPSPNTIKPLVAALSFHQCFEGMGLGGCISQAQFKWHTITIMVLLFCLTIPIGIGVGVGISKMYNENSPTALIVEGTLLSASAGILIFMALVDLLANDFMNSRMLTSLRLQLGASFSLLLGLICMSILVKWGEN